MDIPIDEQMMADRVVDEVADSKKSQLFILSPKSPGAEETKDADTEQQDSKPALPRFLGRECLTQPQPQGQPSVRKGMFLGRECVVDTTSPAPAKPQQRAKIRFLGREIL